MLPMHSATDDDYTRSLSVTASVAYPVPVSASATPANGDVVEIGKVRINFLVYFIVIIFTGFSLYFHIVEIGVL